MTSAAVENGSPKTVAGAVGPESKAKPPSTPSAAQAGQDTPATPDAAVAAAAITISGGNGIVTTAADGLADGTGAQRYTCHPAAAFVVQPRSYDAVTGLPERERGYGTGPQGCNGVSTNDQDLTFKPCHRKVNLACHCPSGAKCSRCCAADWLADARAALAAEEPTPAWTCKGHGGTTIPTDAVKKQLAADRKQVEEEDAAHAARSPTRPRGGPVPAAMSAAQPATPPPARPVPTGFGPANSAPGMVGAGSATAGDATYGAWSYAVEASASGLSTANGPQPRPATTKVAGTREASRVTTSTTPYGSDEKHVARPAALAEPARGTRSGPDTATAVGVAAGAEKARGVKSGNRAEGGRGRSLSRSRSRSRSRSTSPQSPSSPSSSSSSSSGSSTPGSDSESDVKRSASRKAKKKKAKSRSKRAKRRAKKRAADDDQLDATESAVVNPDGDRIANDGWSRAKRQDSDKGTGGGTAYDRARVWFENTAGAGDDEKRKTAKRMTSLYEYLSSPGARSHPRHALRVVRRALLREVVAARFWHSDSTDFERKARPALLNRGVAWSKDSRKIVDGIDIKPSPHASKRKAETATSDASGLGTALVTYLPQTSGSGSGAGAAANGNSSGGRGRGGPGGARTNG